jgi:propanol-preferring alcohol dehydrogenase
MLAYRLLRAQMQPEFQDVREPHAGPGQVVIRVAGFGLCHTDLIVQSRDHAYWRTIPCPSRSDMRSPAGWKSWERE